MGTIDECRQQVRSQNIHHEDAVCPSGVEPRLALWMTASMGPPDDLVRDAPDLGAALLSPITCRLHAMQARRPGRRASVQNHFVAAIEKRLCRGTAEPVRAARDEDDCHLPLLNPIAYVRWPSTSQASSRLSVVAESSLPHATAGSLSMSLSSVMG